MPLANSLLNKTSSLGIVGLVPCAMAGNKISEWQKGTFLYNQLVKRAKAATLQEFGVIRAMLRYQGESDTGTLRDANAYKGKMQQFFTDLRRDLGLPKLLIIQVALASGGKHYTEIVRGAQLNPELSNVVTVDAKDLQLHKDNLRLTVSSQVLLGHMMADAFTKTNSTTSSFRRDSCKHIILLVLKINFYLFIFLVPILHVPHLSNTLIHKGPTIIIHPPSCLTSSFLFLSFPFFLNKKGGTIMHTP
ncbi:putative carbohydrate esterase [Capsicum annuum]